MYIYVDNSKILAFNASAESGISEDEFWKSTNETIAEPIAEEHGVPLYKYVRGHIVSRTDAEIQADIAEIEEQQKAEQEMQPSTEDRIKELEDAILELAELVGG